MSHRRAQSIAKFHSLGYNDRASANEFAKLWFTQASLIKPAQMYVALASLKQFQVTNPFSVAAFGTVRDGAEPK